MTLKSPFSSSYCNIYFLLALKLLYSSVLSVKESSQLIIAYFEG